MSHRFHRFPQIFDLFGLRFHRFLSAFILALFFCPTDYTDLHRSFFFHIIYPQMRPIRSDYADLSCDTLGYSMAMKICVICVICVTFFPRPSRPKICVHLLNLWDKKIINLRDKKKSICVTFPVTPSGVPPDLQSGVKDVLTYFRSADLQSAAKEYAFLFIGGLQIPRCL